MPLPFSLARPLPRSPLRSADGHRNRDAIVPRYLHISAFPIGNRYSVADSVRSLQLPSAPPTLRTDARAARHYRALPFPNLGARCKAAHISAMQKKPFLVQVVLGFSFSVGLSQCPFRSRRAACLFNHPPQCHKMSN